MKSAEDLVVAEANRLGLRYRKFCVTDAVGFAMTDLVVSKDYTMIPTDEFGAPLRIPTKMEALDYMRLVAMFIPIAITDEIISVFKMHFLDCNESSKISIVQIIGLSKNTSARLFLFEIVNGDLKSSQWAQEAAREALCILNGEIEIGFGNCQGRWIYRVNAKH